MKLKKELVTQIRDMASEFKAAQTSDTRPRLARFELWLMRQFHEKRQQFGYSPLVYLVVDWRANGDTSKDIEVSRLELGFDKEFIPARFRLDEAERVLLDAGVPIESIKLITAKGQ